MLVNSISKKNMLGYAVIFFVLIFCSYWLYEQMDAVNKRNSILIANTLPAQASTEAVLSAVSHLQLSAFRLYGTTIDSAQFSRDVEHDKRRLNNGLQELSELSDDAEKLQSVGQALEASISSLSEVMSNSSIDWDQAREKLNTIQLHATGLSNEISGLNESVSKEAYDRAMHINDQVRAIQLSVPIFLFFVSGIIIAAYFLSRFTIARPIRSLSDELNAMAAQRDLSGNISVGTNDEVGVAACSVNDMITVFRDGTLEVRDAASSLLGSVEQLSFSASKGDSNVEQLSQHIQTLLNSIGTLETSIEESAERSLSVSQTAKVSAQQVKSGAENVRRTSASIGQLAENIEKSREKLIDLQNSGSRVSSVVSAIADIAEQTNLLALNAAIEAARAGESGRGFAVVADEVRTLASRTHDSTHEINGILESIVGSISSTVEQMAENSDRAVETVDLAEETVASLSTIEQSVIDLSRENQLLSEQAQVTKSDASAMRNNIDEIRLVSESVTESTRETRDSVRQLDEVSTQLDRVSNLFNC